MILLKKYISDPICYLFDNNCCIINDNNKYYKYDNIKDIVCHLSALYILNNEDILYMFRNGCLERIMGDIYKIKIENEIFCIITNCGKLYVSILDKFELMRNTPSNIIDVLYSPYGNAYICKNNYIKCTSVFHFDVNLYDIDTNYLYINYYFNEIDLHYQGKDVIISISKDGLYSKSEVYTSIECSHFNKILSKNDLDIYLHNDGLCWTSKGDKFNNIIDILVVDEKDIYLIDFKGNARYINMYEEVKFNIINMYNQVINKISIS